jgi:2-iminobutanoate/2-iminopropanoate deaminase
MARDIIQAPDAPSPPLHAAKRCGRLPLCSFRTLGRTIPVTGRIVGDTIQEQTRQCLRNVSAILEATGRSLERIVSATVILLEEADFEE